MNIYLVRHGETNWNKELKIQGRIDNPLNETGKSQALDLAPKIKGIKANNVIHSSLDRARETFEIVNKELKLNIKPNINDSFIERNFGELEGCDVSSYYETTDFSKVKNYEQDSDIMNRVINGIDQLKEDTIVFCHSHVIKTAIIATNPDKYNYSNTKLKNCCIAHFKYTDNKLKLVEIK